MLLANLYQSSLLYFSSYFEKSISLTQCEEQCAPVRRVRRLLWVGCYERFEFLEVILNCFFNELFKRYLQGSSLNVLRGELWRSLIALSGPTYILCPL